MLRRKPQNIFLMVDGTIRLGDFGISRVLSSTLSVVNTCVGTPLYLSPEICNGEAYDGRCDVWSLGVLLFELCALEHPFKANVMPALILKICQEDAPPLPEPYSEGLRKVCARLLIKDSKQRPHISELLAEDIFASRAATLTESHAATMRKAQEQAQAQAQHLSGTSVMSSSRPKSRGVDGSGRFGEISTASRPKSRGDVSMTRSAELRHQMHAKELTAADKEARKEAAKEAEAKRIAMREQMRKDRLAAKVRSARLLLALVELKSAVMRRQRKQALKQPQLRTTPSSKKRRRGRPTCIIWCSNQCKGARMQPLSALTRTGPRSW